MSKKCYKSRDMSSEVGMVVFLMLSASSITFCCILSRLFFNFSGQNYCFSGAANFFKNQFILHGVGVKCKEVEELGTI